MGFNRDLRNLALSFGRHDVDKFAEELTFKDFAMWLLHLRSEGGATLQDRLYHALEPKLADIQSAVYKASNREFKNVDRTNFLTGYRINPVGYDGVEADKQRALNKIRAKRWETVMRQLMLEKTDPERAARRYQSMAEWFKPHYDRYKQTQDKSIINDLPINL